MVGLAVIWIVFVAFVLGYTVVLQHADLRKIRTDDKRPTTAISSSDPASFGSVVLHTVLSLDQAHRQSTAYKRFEEGTRIHISASAGRKFAIRVLNEDAFGRMEENEAFVSLVESSYTTIYKETLTIPDTGRFYFIALLAKDEPGANVELEVRALIGSSRGI
jgi:hypothetical protein